MNIGYLPGKWSLSDLSGSITNDWDILGVTIGPKYLYQLVSNDRLSFIAATGLGFYRTDVSLSLGNVTISNSKTSLGARGDAGIEYNLRPNLTFGGKATVQYITDAGSGDDAMFFSIGPTVGVAF